MLGRVDSEHGDAAAFTDPHGANGQFLSTIGGCGGCRGRGGGGEIGQEDLAIGAGEHFG